MANYVSTFVSGLQEPIKALILKYIKGVKIIQILDGLVVYESSADVNRIRQLGFFNNSFILLKQFDKKINFEEMIKESADSAKEFSEVIKRSLGKKDKYFRIVCSDENEFVSVDKKQLSILEKVISTQNFLRLDIYSPDLEFWFLRRSEGKGFFMLRLTKNISNKELHRGELRPELSFIMNFLSEPSSSDVFLDCFCGYGSVPYSRTKNFPFKAVICSDIDSKCVEVTQKKMREIQSSAKIVVKKADFFEHAEAENSVDKIVTDPPWGEFTKIEDIEQFYFKILGEFYRVLRKNGIVVFVSSRKDEVENAIKRFGNFKLDKKYDVLVNGKKAGIYRLLK
ncbi:50S ribosomal protein L3 glutamine methyltransferase [uncultured archaeon]|nr:50S ribosomal protein L3 glutamine methyltransferase [uncultured archaeon]